jgi:hypothetical protein
MIAGVSRLAGQLLNTSASLLIDSRDGGSTISSTRGGCTRPSMRAPCLKTTLFKTSHFAMPQPKNPLTTRPSPLVYGRSGYIHCQSPSPTLHPYSSEKEADCSLKPRLNIGLWPLGLKRGLGMPRR